MLFSRNFSLLRQFDFALKTHVSKVSSCRICTNFWYFTYVWWFDCNSCTTACLPKMRWIHKARTIGTFSVFFNSTFHHISHLTIILIQCSYHLHLESNCITLSILVHVMQENKFMEVNFISFPKSHSLHFMYQNW